MNIRDVAKSMFMSGSACAIGAVALFAPTAADAALKYEPSNYAARENLLLQLDGIRNVGLLKAHDSTATTWVNLVNPSTSATLTQYKSNTGSSAWRDNAYYLDGNKYWQTGALAGSANTTIEVAGNLSLAALENYVNYISRVNSDDHGIWIQKDKTTLWWKPNGTNEDLGFELWNPGRPRVENWDGKGFTAVLDTAQGLFYKDGVAGTAISRNTTHSSLAASRYNIGCSYNTSYVAKGTYYAVRIYNRALTAAEVKQNYDLDQIRFVTGIPVTNVVVATAVAELEGREETGVYAFDEDGYTFSAPAKATLNGTDYSCTGYTLETWDGSEWSTPVRFYATSYAATDQTAKVRLTWQWESVGAPLSTDFDPLFDDYVTDGLVLHLDGIRNVGANLPHDYSAAAWTDLAGGKSAVFCHDEPDASGWEADGYYFDARSYALLSEQLASLGKAATVQIVCEADTNALYASKIAQTTRIDWPHMLGCNDNNAMNLYYDLNVSSDQVHHQMTFKCVNTSANANIAKGTWEGKYVTAIRTGGTDKYIFQTTAVADATGNAHRVDTTAADIPVATVYIGTAGSTISLRRQRWFKGKIKAIRVYSKVLSDEDIAKNRAIDEARFFGNYSTEPNVIVASSVRGVSGDTPEGEYYTALHTFTAPASVTSGADTYTPSGYTIETWDETEGAWGESETHSGSTTYAYTSAAGKVRLTWQWNHTVGPGYDLAFNDYVTDGLVVHLDGIRNTGAEAVHDGAATTWADLASDDYASFTGIDSTCGWTGDGYRFNGRTASPAYAILSEKRTLGNTFTAQAVVDFDANVSHRIDTAWPHLFGTTASSGDPFDMYYNQNANSNPGVNFKVANSHVAGGVTSWGGEYMTGLSDGANGALFQTATPVATTAFNKTVGTQTFVFAGGNGGSGGYKDRRFNGVYKSARIYDRALTNAELEKNRAADEVRFFGRSPAATGDLVVASTVEGLAGDLPCGAYRPVGYTFTAPTEATLDGVPYKLKGYTLETWNGSAWADGTTVAGGSSVTPDVSTASKRLTWNWTVKSRLTKVQDSFDVDDYVRDGLYLHFDGIRNAGANAEHSDDAATWANLGTGGASFDAVFDYASNASADDGWAKDGYNFAYGGKFARLGANPAINYFATIQIVCEAKASAKPSGNKYPTYFGSTNDYLNIYGFGAVEQAFFKVFNANRVELMPSQGWQGNYLTAIWNAGANQIFQEDVPASANWSNKWRSNWNNFKDQPFYIGGVYIEGNAEGVNERRLTGKIQAIRVYNRSLSDEELEHNRLVDEARFKGKPPESNVTIATKYGDGTGETLAEEVGNYKVEGTYTFSATQVKDSNDVLKDVAGYYLETYAGDGWTGKIWHDGKEFTYTEGAKVRVTWGPRRKGMTLVIR